MEPPLDGGTKVYSNGPGLISFKMKLGKNLFMIAKGVCGAYDSYPICLTIRHTCKSRLAIWQDLNVNID